MQAKN